MKAFLVQARNVIISSLLISYSLFSGIPNALHWCGRGAFCTAVKFNREVGWSVQK